MMGQMLRVKLWLRCHLKALLGILLGILTVLSIPVTIHSDVFEQGEPLLILKAALRGEPAPVELSDYLKSGPVKPNQPSMAAHNPGRKPPLYVFALDVSGSLTKQPVASIEVERYLVAINGNAGAEHARYCLGLDPQGEDLVVKSREWTSAEVAGGELCRLLDSVSLPANVALWAFGRDSVRVIPGHAEYGGSRFLALEKPKNGQHAMRPLFNWVRPVGGQEREPAPPDGSLTDIEALLSKVRRAYRAELANESQEAHIVILSDFVHDIGPLGGKDEEGLPSEWKSRYRTSRQLLADHVQAVAESGNMLHLVIMQGGAVSYRNVLPVFKDHDLDWERLRETRVGESPQMSAFDFLRSYREAPRPLVFHYTSGRVKPLRVELHFDLQGFEGSELRIGLAADGGEQSSPFKIWLKSPRSGYTTKEYYTGLVSLAGRGYSRVVLRGGEDGDRLSLEPSMVLEPHEAQRLRLLIAVGDTKHGGEAAYSERVTYSIPIEFRKDLPRLSALFILALVPCLLVSGTLALMSFFLWVPVWLRPGINGLPRLSAGGHKGDHD